MTTTSYRENLARLERAQKPAFGTAAYSRYLNRPAARRVAALVHGWGMTPNGATAVSASFTALGLLFLAIPPPTWWSSLIVATCLAAGYVMDSVDGQLARLSGTSSLAGEWLDHTVDTIKTVCLPLCLLISWHRWSELPPGWLLLPLAAVVVAAVTYFGLMVMPLVRRLHASAVPVTTQPAQVAGSPTTEHPLRKWALLPLDYGVQCWLYVLFFLPVFSWIYLAQTVINTALALTAIRKWWGELRAMDRANQTTAATHA